MIAIAILALLGLFVLIAGLCAASLEDAEYQALHSTRAKEIADFLAWAKKRGDPNIIKMAEQAQLEMHSAPANASASIPVTTKKPW